MLQGGEILPRIILAYEKDSKSEKFAIWCKKVPPTVGGELGELVIPNVERKADSYEYLSFKRLKDDYSAKPDDIVIYLYTDPTKTGKIELPYNGGDTDEEITVAVNWNPNDKGAEGK